MARGKGGSCAGVIFMVVWSAFVLVFDGVLAWQWYRQLEALSFPQTPGKIVKSSVETHRGNKGGSTYSIEVEFTYEVNGVKYTGDRYRAATMSSSDRGVFELVKTLRPGTKVDVYYRPERPQESLLKPGLEGIDLFFPLFLLPFNAIAMGGWLHGWELLRNRLGRKVIGGFPYFEHGMTTRVRLVTPTPLILILVVLGALSFALIFILGFTVGINPSLFVMECVWGLLFAIAIYIYFKQVLTGETRELLVEEDLGQLSVASTKASYANLTVPFRDVGDLAHDSMADEATILPAVQLYYRASDGTIAHAPIVETNDSSAAADLIAWIKDKIRWQEPDWIGEVRALQKTREADDEEDEEEDEAENEDGTDDGDSGRGERATSMEEDDAEFERRRRRDERDR